MAACRKNGYRPETPIGADPHMQWLSRVLILLGFAPQAEAEKCIDTFFAGRVNCIGSGPLIYQQESGRERKKS